MSRAGASTSYAGVVQLRHIDIGGRRAIRLNREWTDEWFERHTRQAQDWPTVGLAG